MPVRLGVPRHVNGLTDVLDNPIYATGVGLLLYGHHQEQEGNSNVPLFNNSMKGMMGKMKSWFSAF